MQINRTGKTEVLKINHLEDMEYLTFPALDNTKIVTHLFSTRLGGVSEGIFRSMNLSYTRGDKREAVSENFARVARALGRNVEDFVCSDQTHTTNVRRVTASDRGKGVVFEKDYADVDGLITDEPGIVLATFYADCVPLFFVDTVHKAIGLSHSGWRGTVNKIGAHTLEEMGKAYGTKTEDVVAAIGPSICRMCYEVSEDVAGEFAKAFEEKTLSDILFKKDKEKYRLDLWKANYHVLRQAGIKQQNISITDICTCCNPEYLFSHRASRGKRGNLGAFLSLCPT
ncbi:MAG: peptidoglycan editing factor PgeF [Clostridiales bacterium]|nr:peptidoglycan editing factor PgeF [Clostridiales bacterium]